MSLGGMSLLGFSSVIVVLGLMISVCESRRCYKCNGENSLASCDLDTCSSGPDCRLSVYKNSHGTHSFYGSCTTASSCRHPSGHHHTHTPICTGCCTDQDECVPGECQRLEPYQLTEGVTCEQCSGGECGVYPGTSPEWKCDSALPYCMNIVKNNADGSKHVTKGCASKMDCDSLWWNDSRHRSTCKDFDPSSIYTSNFTCTYCCMTEHCNRDIRPHQETLFAN